jgi:hypothetical protein
LPRRLAGEEEWLHNSLSIKYSNILDKLGYIPVSSKAARILHDAAKKSFEMFGRSASKAIVGHMCSINGLSEEELLTNCDLLQTSLYKILRKGADVTFRNIKAEILPHAILIDPTISVSDISNPQFTVEDILKRICIAETLEFIRDNPLGKRIAFLYENEYSKNGVLSAFLTKVGLAILQRVFCSPKVKVVIITIIITTLTVLYHTKNSYRNLRGMMKW